MTVDDAGSNPPSFPGAEAPGTSVPVDPGAYSVSEAGPGGYTMSQSADCSGSIALGETKTCTVTNDDDAPKLTLVKEVVNNSGGTALASEWDLAADGPTGFSGAGPTVSSPPSIDAGSYDLSEDASSETAMILGEVYRNNAEWKFRAVGQGYSTGLAGIARDFGVNIG